MNDLNDTDIIYIRDLVLNCIIGIFDNERTQKQKIVINAEIYTNMAKACLTDDINDAVDYKALKKEIIAYVEQSSFNLIEKLAQGIADICLKNQKILKIVITLDKPGALRHARSVAVKITRFKKTN